MCEVLLLFVYRANVIVVKLNLFHNTYLTPTIKQHIQPHLNSGSFIISPVYNISEYNIAIYIYISTKNGISYSSTSITTIEVVKQVS